MHYPQRVQFRVPFRGLAAILLGLSACASPTGDSQSTPVAPPVTGLNTGLNTEPSTEPGPAAPVSVIPTPWTDAFSGKAMLLADRILVEGPAGLIDHCALTLDDALFVCEARAVANGLERTLRPRSKDSGQEGSSPMLRAQLDAWQLAAYTEIRLRVEASLEHVTVTAEGDVFWQDTNGNTRREPRIVIEGPVSSPMRSPGESGGGGR